jgi:AraC-like DNA-binding protein
MLTSHNFVSSFFTGNLYPVDPIEYLVFDISGDDELIDKIFSMLIEQSRGDEYSGRIIDNLVSIFFYLIIRKEDQRIIFSKHEEENRYIAYINEHFKTVSLPDVADHFNISVAHCSRLIKSLTGKNFHELVSDARFRQALSLLTSTNIKIGDISKTLGFKNQETFMRNFKKVFGLSPGQYRSTQKLLSQGFNV